MADWDHYKARFVSICNEWDSAEEDIKVAEQINNKVVIPSVSELRYAGRRIIEALREIEANGPEEKINGLLQDAEFDCHRARHDAIDAATSKIAVDLEIAAKKIGHAVILKVFPDFPVLVRNLNEIRDKITQSRRNRSNREEIYSSLEAGNFHSLIDKYKKFTASEPIMKSMARKQRIERVLHYVFTAAALLVAAISLYIAISQS